jgi:predicted alpha/beta-fold hydrolase
MPREKGQTRDTDFRPAWWLPGAHAQTIAGRLLRERKPPPLRRERLDTPDGDFLDVDLTESVRAGTPLVVLLHGLEGSSSRGYALNLYRELERRGIGAIGVNSRGCSGEPNRTPRAYHSGETGDLRFILSEVEKRYPGSPVGVIGFSLGGNALLKFLGEEGDAAAARLRACVTVSVPFDLGACADALEGTRMGRFYTGRFLTTLKEKTVAKAALLDGLIDLDCARASTTFREFDDAVTAPLHGFESAEDYYSRCSSNRFLSAVRVPTRLLQARDDPFLPPGMIPEAAIRANPALEPVILEKGGHVGFIAGPPWAPRFWAERNAAEYFAARMVDGAGGGGNPQPTM